MKKKANRLDAIKMIISSKDISSQEELLQALGKEGFELTQATLSRDLKQLKVAKAANMNGKYVYVLPNNIMYKRSNDQSASEMLMTSGFISLHFSKNIAVIRTRPGYASSMAYDIDNRGRYFPSVKNTDYFYDDYGGFIGGGRAGNDYGPNGTYFV